MRLILTFYLLVNILPIRSEAQALVKNDFKMMDTVFCGTNTISARIRYLYFDGNGGNKPIDSLIGMVSVYHQYYLASFQTVEYLRNGKYVVVADKVHNLIVFAKDTSKSGSFYLLWDSLLKRSDAAISLIDSTDSAKSYKFSFAHGPVSSSEVSFNPNNYQVNRFVCFYRTAAVKTTRKPGRLEVLVGQYKYSTFDPSDFSEYRYFFQDKNQFVTSAPFKGYQIINSNSQ